ncbi:MAG TPA: hypothetical protein VMV26_13735 [Alphaproteobacteria bacterium]|jgi:hypothetical protein|nr:hypothetical protein [Alphaproteobacteria bacterium]
MSARHMGADRPEGPPRDAVALGPLGFYDTLPERDWIRLGAVGRCERRRAYETVVAALTLARQQERPAAAITRLEQARRRLVAEHRATLRWRRRQEQRRRLARILLGGEL